MRHTKPESAVEHIEREGLYMECGKCCQKICVSRVLSPVLGGSGQGLWQMPGLKSEILLYAWL